jgi:hypothetical protein
MPDVRTDTIIDTLTLLVEPGHAVELRALEALPLNYQRPQPVSGDFDDLDKLAEAAAGLQQAEEISITLNAVNPTLLARAADRLRLMRDKDASTSDADVIRRRWLPINGNPLRPSGISASDAEHESGLSRACEVRNILRVVRHRSCWLVSTAS